MKLAIVGTHKSNDYKFIEDAINKYIECNKINKSELEIVSGDAIGVDSLARQYTIKNNIQIKIFSLNHDKFGNDASLIRNTEIISYCDSMLAFPSRSSRGIYDSINKAIKLNKKCLTIMM